VVAALREVGRLGRLVVVASAAEAELVGALRAALGPAVVALPPTEEARSRLAFALLAAVNGGRFKMYRQGDQGDAGAGRFWRALERGRCAPRPGRRLRFWDPAGEQEDYLLSAALCAQAGRELLARPTGAGADPEVADAHS
jgi:hypothetical protein